MNFQGQTNGISGRFQLEELSLKNPTEFAQQLYHLMNSHSSDQ